MPLTPGTRLGAYTIGPQIGVGGMGEVYRATDSHLGREVAIKVLPEAFAQDAERLARFEREARTLASLNHPNVAIIHGLEQSDGVRALVMELVEGPTLADRIAQGRAGSSGPAGLPTDEALGIAHQIAEALEAAHEQGIVHRDLKPANIKVRPDGTVKVLDFGLAKMIDGGPAKAGHYGDGTLSPTITTPAMTQMGVILGTAAYMSPEQAKGREVDKRSDLWAFGAVVYEMLTGRRAFDGEDMSETLATVIKSDPSWTSLPADVPPVVRALLRTCLQKDPRRRAVDATTALFVLNEAGPGAEAILASTRPRQSSVRARTAYALAGAMLATMLVGGIAWRLRPAPAAPALTRFSVELPSGQQFTNTGRPVIALSPDGMRIAYVANRRLYLRSLSEDLPKEVQGTEDPEGVTTPSFSPDGNSIAFVAASERTLKRISINGGVAVAVSPIGTSMGVNWTPEGIVFAERPGNVFRVSPNGGQRQLIFKPGEGDGSYGAHLLPGGAAMLLTEGAFSNVGPNPDAIEIPHISVVLLATGEKRTLIERGADARYVSTGHVVYAVDGTLFGVRFDLERLQIVGAPVPLLEGVRRSNATPAAQYSLSSNGSLVYLAGSALADLTMALLDRQGGVTRLKVPNASYLLPRFSPDGKQVAVEIDNASTSDIWIYDLSGAHAMRQLTLGGRNRFPVWSRDGKSVAFSSDRAGDVAVWQTLADGSGSAERVTTPEAGIAFTPLSWHPREQTLLMNRYSQGRLRGASALWTYSVTERKASPVAGVESEQPITAEFSPDGRWIAYHTSSTIDGSARSTVFVKPYPATDALYRIDAGGQPVWSQNGMELFYARATQLLVTTLTTSPSFANSVPSALPTIRAASFYRNYDVSADGTRILAIVPALSANAGDSTRPRIEVVLNWSEELKRLLPAE